MAAPFTVLTVDTPSLGNRSYVVHDGIDAFVVDPQRDIDRVEELLTAHDITLRAVFETHLHNDYVTGGLALAERHGAAYHVNALDGVSFGCTPISDGQVVTVGDRMRVTAMSTPGHTFTHLSYALHDASTDVSAADAVFSGGSLLFGSTGRPDLLGPEHTHELARHQHTSVHRLADTLPDDAHVHPTHGFGSFCSATQADADASTIGRERRVNPALQQDVETWLAELLEVLGVWPAYYAHMAPANSAGPRASNLTAPMLADATAIRRRIGAREWVVDLRTRTAFAAGHAPGSLNFGLDGSLATYLGWLIPWGTPLTLLGETADDVASAQRELSRIGIDRPAAHATGGPQDWSDRDLASFPTATFADFDQVRDHRTVHVLDVRQHPEYAEAHLGDSQNIPLHELLDRLDEVPAGEVWVHCAGGYRASVAASILAASGRRPVAIDDGFERAIALGLARTEQAAQ